MDIITQKSTALKTIEFQKSNLVLGIVCLFTLFFNEMSAQPFIRTSGGLGQYGYIEKNAAATNFLVANGGYGNIYQYGVRSYINGSTNNYAYTGSGSCARGDDATANYSFGSGTLNTGSTVYSSVFVEYCGPSYSCGSMTPTGACFNERSFFVMDFVPKTDALVSSACYTTTNTNVVMTFTIDNNNTSGQSLNRLWLVNDGTAQENTDINATNDAFRVYYEPATGSEVFNGNESSQPLYGNYGGNATNNNEYGSDALGISIPQNTTGGLRCYVVLQGTSTYLNNSAKTKTIRLAVVADGINITPNRDTSYSKMIMDLTRPSNSYITINDIVTPTFSAVSPICTGDSLSALPTTSTNGIVGTWSPALDNTTTTIYTFTPNAEQCASTTTLTITVNPNNTVGTASSTPTLCLNTALTATHTTTGATGIGTVTGLPTGVTAAWASNTITISGTPTTSGVFNYSILLTGGCGSVNATGTITVDNTSVGGEVTGGTAICSGTTCGLLTLSGYTGSINRWEYSVSPFTSWTTIVNTSATYTSGALTQTTQFRAVVQNGVCSEDFSDATSVDINTTTWSSGVWGSGAPNATTAAVIASTYTSTGNIDACSLTVNNGATVVISSGHTVTLSGSLTAIVGSFVTFNNNANLIQSGSTNTNSGAIIIKRDSSFLKRLDYTLWSSPVANQQLKAFSPGTLDERFYTYNTQTIVSPATAANIYVVVPNPTTTNFETAKGYLIRVPNTHSTTGAIWTGSFTGVPNNGNYSYTLVDGGAGEQFNLVGNPYPSPIDAVAFVNDPTNFANTTATLYFWRKTNNSANPSYSSWNEGVGYLNPNGEAPEANFFLNQVINVGQGFFVEASGSGTLLDFDNSMRIDNHDNQFFKSSQATTTSVERNRIWLKTFNSSGLTTQTLLGYVTNATLSIDKGIDSRDINDGDLGLSTLIGPVPYAIQGRPLPFDASDIVPLNFKVTSAGDYTITIDHVDGLFTGGAQSIYLKDNLTTTIHNLNTGAYSFASDAGTFTNRFEIIYALPLGTENPIFTANNVVIYNSNDEFVINTGNIIMSSVKVFDIRGRLLQERKGINASQIAMTAGLANEVLLVQITTGDGIVVTKKVIR